MVKNTLISINKYTNCLAPAEKSRKEKPREKRIYCLAVVLKKMKLMDGEKNEKFITYRRLYPHGI